MLQEPVLKIFYPIFVKNISLAGRFGEGEPPSVFGLEVTPAASGAGSGVPGHCGPGT